LAGVLKDSAVKDYFISRKGARIRQNNNIHFGVFLCGLASLREIYFFKAVAHELLAHP
jgi:hypothetical protein